MKKNPELLSFQLRPHIAAMLDQYVSQVRGKMPEAMRAKITHSLVIRKLLARAAPPRDALAYVNVGRKRDGAGVQYRVRLGGIEYAAAIEAARALDVPYAQLIAAHIVDALHPGGNYPTNPDTKPLTTV